MSEFKFACPTCGQHIKCDASQTGMIMDCPTCFQKLTVPQAPAGGGAGQKFILTGTKVKTVSAGARGPAPAAVEVKHSAGPLVVILLLLFIGSAAAVVYWATIFHPRHTAHHGPIPVGRRDPTQPLAPAEPPGEPTEPKLPEPPPPVAPAAPAASDANWMLALDASPLPDTPAAGRIHGQDFKVDRAALQNGSLTLRAGVHNSVEFGFIINFGGVQPEALSGRAFNVTTNAEKAARISLRWKENDSVQKAEFSGGYALRLEFGALGNNRLPGRLYLCLPDDEKSYLLGAFNASVSKPKLKK